MQRRYIGRRYLPVIGPVSPRFVLAAGPIVRRMAQSLGGTQNRGRAAAAPPTRLATVAVSSIRAEMARQRLTGRQLAELVGHDQMWVSRRIGRAAAGPGILSVDELGELADALGVSPVELLAPRLQLT